MQITHEEGMQLQLRPGQRPQGCFHAWFSWNRRCVWNLPKANARNLSLSLSNKPSVLLVEGS
jgi:hypothetical protein